MFKVFSWRMVLRLGKWLVLFITPVTIMFVLQLLFLSILGRYDIINGHVELVYIAPLTSYYLCSTSFLVYYKLNWRDARNYTLSDMAIMMSIFFVVVFVFGIYILDRYKVIRVFSDYVVLPSSPEGWVVVLVLTSFLCIGSVSKYIYKKDYLPLCLLLATLTLLFFSNMENAINLILSVMMVVSIIISILKSPRHIS